MAKPPKPPAARAAQKNGKAKMSQPAPPPARQKVEAITHDKAKRKNIPHVEQEGMVARQGIKPVLCEYPRNRDLDPQLCWRGKEKENAEWLKLEVPPLYVQEHISPRAIIENLRRQTRAANGNGNGAGNLFGVFAAPEEGQDAFYQHQQPWTNRMIFGDSLTVMASLAQKEDCKGQVQCIYMDPPYGVDYGSNWQPSTKSTDVGANEETGEPEAIRAFRDTWHDEIHSYLSYLRDRLIVAHDLLSPSGSIFLQIGEENVHRVSTLMDEVFGDKNRVATITYATTSGSSANTLPQVANYLLWYAYDKERMKYRKLFEKLNRREVVEFFSSYVRVQLADGQTRRLNAEEKNNPQNSLPEDAVVFKRTALDSQGVSTTGRSESYFWRGVEYPCPANRQWSISSEGMGRMDKAGRLHSEDGTSLAWKRYEHEVPGNRINNLWATQMPEQDKQYVVQTADSVIQRCILMTTDPGDLVLDPTGGSGATASVAEHWGRRWIIIDASRVALAIARARLMGNAYPYYLMQDSEEGAEAEQELGGQPLLPPFAKDIGKGFVCERVGTLSPKLFANNAEIDIIWNKHAPDMARLQKTLRESAGLDADTPEWQIPLTAPADWPPAAQKAHAAWKAARQKRQDDIDRSMAACSDTEILVDQPKTARGIVRVTGPFTMESLSPHRVLPAEGAEHLPKSEAPADRNFLKVVFDNLRAAGIQNTRKNQRMTFDDLTVWDGGRHIQFLGKHADENGAVKRVAICVGPEYGTVDRGLFRAAALEAADMFDMLVVMGFAYEAHADTESVNIGGMPVLRVRLNHDLHMAERLKKTENANLFVVFGEPDIKFTRLPDGQLQVEILGVDIFDPRTGQLTHSGPGDIACWMVDTKYNGESFNAHLAYFCGGGRDPYKQLKAALRADINRDAWAALYGSKSHPFPPPDSGRIAVKAINHYGDEVLKVFQTQDAAQE